MRKDTVHFEIENDNAWIYMQRTCGQIPNVPLHTVLRWIVEQLNFGCWNGEFDESGETVTLVIGSDASLPFDDPVEEKVEEYAKSRSTAVLLAGLFVDSREAGVHPQDEARAEDVRFEGSEYRQSSENMRMNTEFHYAFRLVDLLERIHDKTFVFSCPPIKGVLPRRVSALLREATRAYLYELNGTSVALCRALLEGALRDRIDQNEKGTLKSLINMARQKQVLSSHASKLSHKLRKLGNVTMHEREPTDEEAWRTLQDIRFILHEVARPGEAAS